MSYCMKKIEWLISLKLSLFKLGCTVVVDPSSGEDTNVDLYAVLLFFGALVEKKRKGNIIFCM